MRELVLGLVVLLALLWCWLALIQPSTEVLRQMYLYPLVVVDRQ